MTTIPMTEESNDAPAYTDGTDTDRYAQFLDDAPRWLHHERARIDELDRSEVNELAQHELRRRDHGGPIEDDPRRVWAWLFVSYVLRGADEYVDDEDGDGDA